MRDKPNQSICLHWNHRHQSEVFPMINCILFRPFSIALQSSIIWPDGWWWNARFPLQMLPNLYVSEACSKCITHYCNESNRYQIIRIYLLTLEDLSSGTFRYWVFVDKVTLGVELLVNDSDYDNQLFSPSIRATLNFRKYQAENWLQKITI